VQERRKSHFAQRRESRDRVASGRILHGRISIAERRICPCPRHDQGRAANDSRLSSLRKKGLPIVMTHPFDLKAALLAKHAQHPVIIHFPIALFIISVTFDLIAIWRSNPTMARAAFYNLIGAALTAPVAIASGLIAWQWQFEGTKLKGNLHLLL